MGYDTNNKQPDGKSVKKERITAVDTKAICTRLKCQPSDIMEVIPNTWENAERLCEILDCSEEELPKRVPMEQKQ